MMFFLLFLYLLFANEGERVVFVNDSKYNKYTVFLSLNGKIIKQKTLKPQETVSFSVCPNIDYEVKTKRITQFGEYKKRYQGIQVVRYTKNTKFRAEKDNMYTVYLFPQDVP
jgi:hypothetical protein